DSGTFLANGFLVTFDGTGTQTISRGVPGTETFSSVAVDKASGTLNLNDAVSTSVNLSGSTGDVLQLLNAGGINLGGNILTLLNNGGNILVSGGARNITTGPLGSLIFSGSKIVTASGRGKLVM